ncbi:hypothetical protein QD47_18925 [Paenibacillus terrae]|uniref:Uncharacterized protein n=1 Tax=Paenibacillus terrae TaxID=159743 RepID=A0A0D7WY05_9BACL|nr:hypothetical protein QD47_18925 [Paenibacillus terrae]
MTYLSWVDIATNKLFIVYPFEGQFIGIEGRITMTHKKGYFENRLPLKGSLFCSAFHSNVEQTYARNGRYVYWMIKNRTYVFCDTKVTNSKKGLTSSKEKFTILY